MDAKLKLNIEMERLSKQLSRIPIYSNRPEQYYDSMSIYARNINNQINSLAISLNRIEKDVPKEKE